MRRSRTPRGKGATQAEPVADMGKLVKEIRKAFGDRSIVKGNEIFQPERNPTGIFTLDLALLGGVFDRCITELHGRRSSGKTTTLYKIMANAQKKYPDRAVGFVDAELTYDPVWAEKLGVNTSDLLVAQPQSGEEAVDVTQALMAHPDVCMVGLDSIAAMTPMKEVEEAAQDIHVGIHSKLVTRLVRKVLHSITLASAAGRPMSMVCTNQDRAGIGKWAPPGQEAITNPGGKALEHYAALQIKFKNKETLKKDDEGFELLNVNEHAFTIEKNKFNAGVRKGEFQLQRIEDEEYGLVEGDIDCASTMISTAKRMGIYTGGGRSWTLELPSGSETLGNVDEWVKRIYSDRDLYNELYNHLIALHAAKLGMPEYMIESIYAQAR